MKGHFLSYSIESHAGSAMLDLSSSVSYSQSALLENVKAGHRSILPLTMEDLFGHRDH